VNGFQFKVNWFRLELLSNKERMRDLLVVLLSFVISVSHAQVDSSSHSCKRKKVLKVAIVPAVLLTTSIINYGNHGFYSSLDARNDVRKNFPNFHTKLDNYMQFVPIVLVYGLDALGIKAQHDLINRTLILAKAEIFGNGITQILKYSVKEQRPSGTATESFPSGHTTQAFISATFMHHEYGEKSVWYSILAYSMATSTGAMRMMNDRHWFSDVLAGAAVGIFSTEMVYLTHQYKWGKKATVLLPTFNQQGVGMVLNTTF
jgi:membrane-associated phospholipid phosphatase